MRFALILILFGFLVPSATLAQPIESCHTFAPDTSVKLSRSLQCCVKGTELYRCGQKLPQSPLPIEDPKAIVNEGQPVQGQGALVTGRSSGGMLGAALDTVLTTGSGGIAQATDGGAIVSTSGTGALNARAWVSFQYRDLSGNISGDARDLMAGMDFAVGTGTRLGFVLSSAKADLSVSGTDFSSKTVSFGPYFRADISERYYVRGYLLVAEPEYALVGTTYDADRVAAGLSFNAKYRTGNTELRSHLSLDGFSEDHPAAGGFAARDISSITGSIGTRAVFNPDAAFSPHLGLTIDFNRYKDGFGNTTENAAPRISAGFEYDSGAGKLTFDVNKGEIFEGTDDVSGSIAFRMDF